MEHVSNQLLFDRKLKNLEFFKKNFIQEIFQNHLDCCYHGIDLKIFSHTDKLNHSLLSFLPNSWQIESKSPYEIYVLHPDYFDCSLDTWCEETSQDCYSLENNTKAIQRDFAAWFLPPHKVLLICEDIVSDGFHNFLRWFISERLIAQDKYVIHASCVLGKNNLAHIFLGHSGAGKTTITKLSTPRLVLGDDMNLINFENDQLMVEAGAIGGLFNSMIGYDTKKKVKTIYWLKQSSENKIISLPKTIAHQKLLASFANLNWPTLPEKTASKLIAFSLQAVSSLPCFELQFKKDLSVWDMIDP